MSKRLGVTLVALSTMGAHAQGTPAKKLVGTPAPQAEAKGNLPETLHKLDVSSARFKSASATFHKEQYTSPIPDPDITNGSTFVTREGGHTRMGARFEGGEAQTIAYDNGTVRILKPGLNCYNDYSGKGNQAKIESFLTLGFGGSGRDLEASWNIQDQGEETLQSDGHPAKVEKLLLNPKEQSVKDLVKSVTLWLDLERDIALKQVLISPTDDKQTAVYSNIRLNQPVDTARYAIGGKPCSAGGKKAGAK